MNGNSPGINPQAAITRLYGPWHFAVCGLLGAAFVFACFSAFRGFGFQLFYLEKIPGEFILSFLPSRLTLAWANYPSRFETFDWLTYSAFGAFLGVLYRRIFQILKLAGWNAGLMIGAIQWLVLGVLIAWMEPRLPGSIAFLPADSFVGSMNGLGLGVWILLQNVFFGGFLGITATKHSRKIGGLAGEATPESWDAETRESRLAA
jgi:hypothetical protein